MNALKGMAMAGCLAASCVVGAPAFAQADATGGVGNVLLAKSDSSSSEADIRAKAADCSRQADEKKLHGAERKKFRAACKRK